MLVEGAGSTAAIVVPDIPACESVVHIVDALLLQQVRCTTCNLYTNDLHICSARSVCIAHARKGGVTSSASRGTRRHAWSFSHGPHMCCGAGSRPERAASSHLTRMCSPASLEVSKSKPLPCMVWWRDAAGSSLAAPSKQLPDGGSGAELHSKHAIMVCCCNAGGANPLTQGASSQGLGDSTGSQQLSAATPAAKATGKIGR